MTYIRGTTPDPSKPQPWYAGFARITKANTAHPVVQSSRPIAAPIHTQDICFSGILCGVPGFGNNRDLLDYIWNAVAPNGTAFGVYASDGPATGGGGVSVIVIRQVSGPRFGRGAPS
jgi:CO dehydrogenase/acetyl-CoA synthase alpha subunit